MFRSPGPRVESCLEQEFNIINKGTSTLREHNSSKLAPAYDESVSPSKITIYINTMEDGRVVDEQTVERASSFNEEKLHVPVATTTTARTSLHPVSSSVPARYTLTEDDVIVEGKLGHWNLPRRGSYRVKKSPGSTNTYNGIAGPAKNNDKEAEQEETKRSPTSSTTSRNSSTMHWRAPSRGRRFSRDAEQSSRGKRSKTPLRRLLPSARNFFGGGGRNAKNSSSQNAAVARQPSPLHPSKNTVQSGEPSAAPVQNTMTNRRRVASKYQRNRPQPQGRHETGAFPVVSQADPQTQSQGSSSHKLSVLNVIRRRGSQDDEDEERDPQRSSSRRRMFNGPVKGSFEFNTTVPPVPAVVMEKHRSWSRKRSSSVPPAEVVASDSLSNEPRPQASSTSSVSSASFRRRGRSRGRRGSSGKANYMKLGEDEKSDRRQEMMIHQRRSRSHGPFGRKSIEWIELGPMDQTEKTGRSEEQQSRDEEEKSQNIFLDPEHGRKGERRSKDKDTDANSVVSLDLSETSSKVRRVRPGLIKVSRSSTGSVVSCDSWDPYIQPRRSSIGGDSSVGGSSIGGGSYRSIGGGSFSAGGSFIDGIQSVQSAPLEREMTLRRRNARSGSFAVDSVQSAASAYSESPARRRGSLSSQGSSQSVVSAPPTSSEFFRRKDATPVQSVSGSSTHHGPNVIQKSQSFGNVRSAPQLDGRSPSSNMLRRDSSASEASQSVRSVASQSSQSESSQSSAEASDQEMSSANLRTEEDASQKNSSVSLSASPTTDQKPSDVVSSLLSSLAFLGFPSPPAAKGVINSSQLETTLQQNVSETGPLGSGSAAPPASSSSEAIAVEQEEALLSSATRRSSMSSDNSQLFIEDDDDATETEEGDDDEDQPDQKNRREPISI